MPESRHRSGKGIAGAGSAAFLVLVPGVVAGLIPWLLTGWRMEDAPFAIRAIGVVLLAAGVGFLLHASARFVFEGLGTPAPVAPTKRLVVGGVYRYVRNPMYLAVGAAIVGQALLLGQPGLLAYSAIFGLVVVCFARFYEEPTLSARFGATYDTYRREVPGWLPRLRPWESGD